MLISHSHKFIFIHIYKTAGSSVRRSLSLYEHKSKMRGVLQRVGIVNAKEESQYKGIHVHSSAREIKENLPKMIYDTYFKFAFVRNPWDWQVSLYHYMLQTKVHFQHDLAKSLIDFEHYLEWRINEDKNFQKDFVTDLNGNLIVDFIGRFENIAKDFEYVSKKLDLRCALPHVNKSYHRDYRTYYNERTQQLIYDHFREDIELFGYTF